MRRSTVPVTMGSPAFRRIDLDVMRVTDATFAAGDVLPSHAHEQTILAVMLDGGFDLAFARRRYDCTAGTAFVEPAGERHANHLGGEGAQVLVLELPVASPDDRIRAKTLGRPSAQRRPELLALALDLRRELRDDASSTMAIEALAWELLGRATGSSRPARDTSRGGAWVDGVRELLHARLDRSLRLADLAREVGVHRVHLGRVFRSRFGENVGDYHRRIRIEWAARELAAGRATVMEMAMRAGFADQPHFTRLFKRQMGITPAAFTRKLRLF